MHTTPVLPSIAQGHVHDLGGTDEHADAHGSGGGGDEGWSVVPSGGGGGGGTKRQATAPAATSADPGQFGGRGSRTAGKARRSTIRNENQTDAGRLPHRHTVQLGGVRCVQEGAGAGRGPEWTRGSQAQQRKSTLRPETAADTDVPGGSRQRGFSFGGGGGRASGSGDARGARGASNDTGPRLPHGSVHTLPRGGSGSGSGGGGDADGVHDGDRGHAAAVPVTMPLGAHANKKKKRNSKKPKKKDGRPSTRNGFTTGGSGAIGNIVEVRALDYLALRAVRGFTEQAADGHGADSPPHAPLALPTPRPHALTPVLAMPPRAPPRATTISPYSDQPLRPRSRLVPCVARPPASRTTTTTAA